MDIPIDIKLRIKAILEKGEILTWKELKELEEALKRVSEGFKEIYVPGLPSLEEIRKFLERYKEKAKLIEVPEVITGRERIVFPTKEEIEKERMERAREEIARRFIEAGIQPPSLKNIAVAEKLLRIYQEILKGNVSLQDAQVIINNLSSAHIEQLNRILTNKKEILKLFKEEERTQDELLKATKQQTEETKKQEESLELLTREEFSRLRLIEKINAFRKDPAVAAYLKTQGDINEKTYRELQFIFSKIQALKTASSILYRQRLEWDRIGNTLRYFGLVFSGIFTAGIRNAAFFSIELLRAQGALQLTAEQAVSLNYLGRALGITLTDLTKTIGNIYQALINAGQGTSFVAERVREALSSVGLESMKLGQAMTPSYELFWKTIFALKELDTSLGRSWVAQKLLGSEFEKFAPFLALSKEELLSLKEESEKFAKSLGINSEKITKDFMSFSLTIEKLRMFLISLFSQALKSAGDFFRKLGDLILGAINLWNKLPEGLKNFALQFVLYLGAGSLVIGNLVRFGNLIQRIVQAVQLMSSAFSASSISIAGSLSVISAPLLGILTAITLISGAITGLIEKRERYYKEEQKAISEWEEAIGRTNKTIQIIERAERLGFHSSIASAEKLEKEFIELRQQQRLLEKEGYGLESYKIFDAFIKKVERIKDEYLKWYSIRQSSVLTEDELKRKLDEIEIKIKENNLSLYEQYKLFSELYELGKAHKIRDELLNQILEKRASIVKSVLEDFRKVEEELQKPVVDIPFLNSFIEGVQKLRQLEEEYLVVKTSKTIQETQKYEEILNKLRLRLREKFALELTEQELKTLKTLGQEEVQQGKWNIENYYKAVELEEKKYQIERLSFEKKFAELLTLTRKEAPEQISKIEELYNLERRKTELEHKNNIQKIWEDAIKSRIQLYELEDERFKTLLRQREISIEEINRIYSERFKILLNLKTDIEKIPDLELRRQYLTKVQNLLYDLQVEKINEIEKAQDQIYRKVREMINLDTKEFETKKRTAQEELNFYSELIKKVESLNLPLEVRKRILDELLLKVKETSRKIFEEEIKLAKDTIQLDTLTSNERLKILTNLMKVLMEYYNKGFIDYKELTKEVIQSLNSLVNTEFKVLSQVSPFENLQERTTAIFISVAKLVKDFKNEIDKLKPEERLLLFQEFLINFFNQVKGLGLSKADIEKIFNSREFQIQIENLAQIFGIPLELLKTTLGNLEAIILDKFESVRNLFKRIQETISSWTSELKEGFYSFSINLEDLFVRIGKEIYDFIVKEFLEKIPIREKIVQFVEEIRNLGSEITFQNLKETFRAIFGDVIDSIKNFTDAFRDFVFSLDISRTLLQLKRNVFDEILNALKDFAKSILISGEEFEIALRNLKERIATTLFNFIVEQILITKLFTQEFLKSLSEAIDEALKGNYSYLNKMIDNFAYQVAKIIPVIQKIGTSIADAFGLTFQEVETEMMEVSDTLQATIYNLWNHSVQLTDRFFAGLERLRERYYSRLSRRILSGGLYETLGEGLTIRTRGIGGFGAPIDLYPLTSIKTLNVNFYGLSFNEQRKVFDLWQDKEELSTILGA